jgi:RNA polymerase sigma-70 factor (ECF subfamily)
MTPARERTAAPLIEFAGLYAAHSRDVRRFALFLSGDAALADDLVSEAFVRVWTARDRVELATVRSYLFAIVRNLFLHDVRAHRRHAPLDERMADNHPDPEHRASDRSDLQVVIAALAQLPEIDRAALLMRADESVSYEEIAAVLGLTSVAARVKVHRARLKLAEARLGARSAIRTKEERHEPHA